MPAGAGSDPEPDFELEEWMGLEIQLGAAQKEAALGQVLRALRIED